MRDFLIYKGSSGPTTPTIQERTAGPSYTDWGGGRLLNPRQGRGPPIQTPEVGKAWGQREINTRGTVFKIREGPLTGVESRRKKPVVP